MERKIDGFDNYCVTDTGEVINVKRNRKLSCTQRKDGYVQVGLWNNGKMKQCYLHRVVYQAFNGAMPDGTQINHIDGNKANNSLSNLECVSASDNQRHAVLLGLRGSKLQSYAKAAKANSKFSTEDAERMRELVASGKSFRFVAKEFNCCHKTVSGIVNQRGVFRARPDNRNRAW